MIVVPDCQRRIVSRRALRQIGWAFVALNSTSCPDHGGRAIGYRSHRPPEII